MLEAAALRQLLVSSVPGDVGVGFGDLADELHAVRLGSLNVGQILGKSRLLLCTTRENHGETSLPDVKRRLWSPTAILTDDSEHAGGLGGFGVAFILGLVVKHGLVDDEDVLAALGDNFVLLPLSDFTSILKPADLQDSQAQELSHDVKTTFELHLERNQASSL